jgi:hypothetical protein
MVVSIKEIVEQRLSATEEIRDLGILSAVLTIWSRLFQIDGTLQHGVNGSATFDKDLKRLREACRLIESEHDF